LFKLVSKSPYFSEIRNVVFPYFSFILANINANKPSSVSYFLLQACNRLVEMLLAAAAVLYRAAQCWELLGSFI